MRAVIQRSLQAQVSIEGKIKASIEKGLVILLGIHESDSYEDIQWLVKKIINLRVFDDEQGIMNLSAQEIGGEFLIISQFTLHASTKKGNRPSYSKAAKPEIAIPLYERFLVEMRLELRSEIKSGEFGANMQVSLINNGPVTIIIDSKNKE
jgi:D-tyrosyl-tRNA(Tyr) deacylase